MEIKEGTKDEFFNELLQKLEQMTNWDGRKLVKYQGFWFPLNYLRPLLSAQKHFKANDSDIILSTLPKSGTTWLKALVFSIANRSIYPNIDQSPLLTSNPHKLVPFIEFDLYWNEENPDLTHIPSPRIFSTHIPLNALPNCILESSECKIIYICRNPLDQFISHYYFVLQNFVSKDAAPLELDEAFDMFCQGVPGPVLEHMLAYWNAHLENPRKVLFLKYEDLKDNIGFNVKKIAEFLGFPFSLEEEEQGLIDEISRVCSFGNLKNLEVNKNGYVMDGLLKNSSYFRKGEVGDWTNYLTPAMAERMKKLMEIKFQGSGLMFNI
ncbi:hypothetical protein MIMGU_mgv1a026637mg [Erythranthe guttata]|uniref:Sulfotransferase n=1 Tax=Erythranthe guttata TaxID=4155 RepID=A0A022QRG5_ERYGU|nr:PREDICTED: cytosolic sulfotransferase 15-like [Erythranthe guttata]EYU30501.1 hypothetical protein MIMGU_mgv1a026637mg [Erythranthe guttata]|eukprot:XP_012845658.1 PREDICTED: cytosolic sulfotransferase 15-like [Erythranthe guttata]